MVVVVIGLVLLATLFSKLHFAWLVMRSRALHHGYWPFLNPYWFARSLPFAPLESEAMYPVTLLAAAIRNTSWSLDTIDFVFRGFVLGRRPLFLTAGISAGFWYRQSYGGNAHHG